MKISQTGEAFMKGFESFSRTSYPDSGGVWTIAWGHTGWYAPGVPVGPGQTCTDEQAQAWFEGDIATAENGVLRVVEIVITQGQFDALVDFAYNEGVGALAHSTLLRYLNQHMVQQAAQQFLRWDYCDHKELEGLEKRRRGEMAMFLAGLTKPSEAAS